MAERTSNRLRRRSMSIITFMLACLVLASCGPLGSDDDTTPTAESVSQPTEAVTTEITEEPGETVTVSQDSTEASSTEAVDAASPIATSVDEGTSPIDEALPSTPEEGINQSSASPVAEEPVSGNATPESGTAPTSGAVFTGGDGTSGATPPPVSDGTPGALLVAVDNSPETSIPESGSPESSPAAVAGDEVLLTDITAALVTSCDPEIVPVLTLSNVRYTTVVDINIRSGPGVDCDPLAISPIGEFQPITLIGGPVIREGEDFVWVQVTAASGESGWIVTTGISPEE